MGFLGVLQVLRLLQAPSRPCSFEGIVRTLYQSFIFNFRLSAGRVVSATLTLNRFTYVCTVVYRVRTISSLGCAATSTCLAR